MHKSKLKLIIAATAALIAELFAPAFSGVAQASPPQFANAFVRPDTHKALAHTGLMVCATPPTGSPGTEASVVLVIPTDSGATDFAVNATAANWIVDSNDMPIIGGVTATFWPGMTSGTTHASNVTGHTITFPSGALTAGTTYCFHITGTNTLTNGTAVTSTSITGGTLFTQTSLPATIDQTNWSTAVVTDNTITVSAVVPPNFSIALGANVDAFTTNLDPGSIVSTTGVTVSVNTNAVDGWIAWVKDATGGLFSTSANYQIDSGLKNPSLTQLETVGGTAFDLVPGQEGYALEVDLTTQGPNGAGFGGCVDHLDPAYHDASGLGGGMLSDSSFRAINACTRDWAPEPGTSDGDVLTLTERATIRGGTPAGSDYSDIITVVGAGVF